MEDLLRVIRDDGSTAEEEDPRLPAVEAQRLYRFMRLQRIFDERMIALQRQGRIGFYGPAMGQEAAVVGAAMAMEPDDWIVPQYREPAAALVRGMPMVQLIGQIAGNSADPVQGRQMPCHYVYRAGNYLSISSPVGTQIPQAAGVAWAMSLRRARTAVLVYFGDGATSTSDFHAGLNFAGVFRVPCVFLCNNNQWAISLPVSRQTAVASLASKAAAYGVLGVRVDGMDALAVYGAVRAAADRARSGGGSTMVEAVTYRYGPHSTSDDPSRYRDEAEVDAARARDPLVLFRRYLERAGLWDAAKEDTLVRELEDEIARAIAEVERASPVPLESMFHEVFETMPGSLKNQMEEALGPRR